MSKRRLFCCPGCGVEITPQSIIPGLHSLTAQQQELVELLAERPGHYFHSSEIIARLWAGDTEPKTTNNIDVQVARIRKRLGRGVIETRKSIGYRLALDVRREYAINGIPFTATRKHADD